MMKLLFTLFVLVFTAHGMYKKSETTYHVPTLHDIKLINQNAFNQNENKEHKAYNEHAEDEYEDTEEKADLRRHEWKCAACNKVCKQKQFKEHIRTECKRKDSEHLSAYPHKCEVSKCKSRFDDITRLRRHMKMKHKIFECEDPESKSRFDDITKLTKHMRIHHEVDKYQYLELIIAGNEEYHNQLKGLYQKNVYYNVSYYTKILPDDGKNTSIVWISGAWVFVHNQKRIAHLEDQNLINPLMFNYYTKRIILENSSREPIHLRTWDFCPISPHGNYYEHVDKYVIYRFEIDDGKYEMGHAKYLPFDAKWQTFPWGQNGEISKNAKDYSWKVREMLEKLSDPHRNFRSNHFPALMYSGSPWNANVYFFPLLDTNIAIPPTEELGVSIEQFAKDYHLKHRLMHAFFKDDSPNSDDMDTMSTMDTITGSTPNHKNEINIDLQNENENFWKKNEDFQKKNNFEESEYFSCKKEKKI